jgi:hypothetical protein
MGANAMKVLLLVTCIVHGYPPSSYQASFMSLETCGIARAEVLKEAARLKAEQDAFIALLHRVMPYELHYPPPAPQVTAVCVVQ